MTVCVDVSWKEGNVGAEVLPCVYLEVELVLSAYGTKSVRQKPAITFKKYLDVSLYTVPYSLVSTN